MNRLKFLLVTLMAFVTVCAMANGWLPPSEDVVVESFDVYVDFDTVHNAGLQLGTRDSVFRFIEQQAVALNSDKLGRFAVWRMLPPIVMVPESVADKVGEVDITVENAPVATLPDTVRDENGDLLLPYSIWAKMTVKDASGSKIYEKDYGLLNGTVPLSHIGKDGKIKQAAAIVGICEAVDLVRGEVYGRYGFDMCKDVDVCPVPESSKYYTFLKIANGDMRRFVDFFTYNDLLGQIYKLNTPFMFLPYDTVSVDATAVEGTILRDGEVDGEYTVEYEGGRVKSFSGSFYTRDDNGKVSKQKLNKLTVQYDKKTGEYKGITTADGQFTRVVFPGYDNVTEWGQKRKLHNFCRTENMIGNFLKLKAETVEMVEMSIDLFGTVYAEGSTTSSLPFGMLKMVADTNNVKFPALTSENHTEFKAVVKYDKNLHIVEREWKGSILLEKDRGYGNYSYIRLDDVDARIAVKLNDEHGEPVAFDRKASGVLKNNWGLGDKLKVFNVYGEGKADVSTSLDKDDIGVGYSGSGNIHISYDDRGNIMLYRIGNVEIIRKVKY